MQTKDRMILVLKPIAVVGHPDDSHSCNVSGGEGYGRVRGGGRVYVHTIEGIQVDCEHG